MNYSIDEMRDLASRFLAEHNVEGDPLYITRLALFGQWLLKQKLQQTPCSTSVPPSSKAQLTFNSSIQELLAKVHDDVEGRYDLTAEDLFDVQSVLAACQ